MGPSGVSSVWCHTEDNDHASLKWCSWFYTILLVHGSPKRVDVAIWGSRHLRISLPYLPTRTCGEPRAASPSIFLSPGYCQKWFSPGKQRRLLDQVQCSCQPHKIKPCASLQKNNCDDGFGNMKTKRSKETNTSLQISPCMLMFLLLPIFYVYTEVSPKSLNKILSPSASSCDPMSWECFKHEKRNTN